MAIFRVEEGWGTQLSQFINAPKQAVFDALTNPEQIVRWDYPDSVNLDLRVNGWIRLTTDGFECEGVIIQLNPPVVFAYQMPTNYPPPDRHRVFNAIIKYQIDDNLGVTRLHLFHTGFPHRELAEIEEKAWRKVCLPKLKLLLEVK